MSTYTWPRGRKPAALRDDAIGRERHLAVRRTDFDAEGALAATRDREAPAPRRRRRPGGVLGAPADNRRDDLWVPLGPATVVHGQAVGLPRISGRVRALAVDDSG